MIAFAMNENVIDADCGEPVNITNGYATKTRNFELVRIEAVYACNSGYTLSGVSVRACLDSGQYEGTEPTCQPGIVKAYIFGLCLT